MSNTMEKQFRMKQLLKVIDSLYNDYIGGNENSYLDGEDYIPFTEERLIEVITNDITTCEGYLKMEDTWEVVEAKHFRFLGKAEIKAVVTGRVFKRHKDEGKWEWEKVNA